MDTDSLSIVVTLRIGTVGPARTIPDSHREVALVWIVAIKECRLPRFISGSIGTHHRELDGLHRSDARLAWRHSARAGCSCSRDRCWRRSRRRSGHRRRCDDRSRRRRYWCRVRSNSDLCRRIDLDVGRATVEAHETMNANSRAFIEASRARSVGSISAIPDHNREMTVIGIGAV